MSNKENSIENRRKIINQRCNDIQFIYRGYFTEIYDIIDYHDKYSKIIRELSETIVSSKVYDINTRELYQSFISSVLLFVRSECRPSDFIFYSIYKIAKTIRDDFKSDRKEFNKTVYSIIISNCVEKDIPDYNEMIKDVSLFAKQYENPENDINSFLDEIIDLLDYYLFDNGYSYLLDDNYENGIKQLDHFIGVTKLELKRSTEERGDIE